MDAQALREKVETQLGELGLPAVDLARQLGMPAMFLTKFLRGETRIPEQYVPSVEAWVEGREVPTDLEGTDEEAPVVGRLVSVSGTDASLNRLEMLLDVGEGPLTLEVVERKVRQLREDYEALTQRMIKSLAQPKGQEHTLDQCAEAILSRTTPQVLEAMDLAMQATERRAWEVIAGTLVMWRNDLLGADLTEVQSEGAGLSLQRMPWAQTVAPPQASVSPSGRPLPLCETCQRPFQPGPNQHRPRFGCVVCGTVETIKTKNVLERKRAAEVAEYQPNLRPETVEFVSYQMGMGPCTCGHEVA